MNYLVTGTDTGVGKTFVTSGLLRSARSKGLDAVGMKPICTGDNSDVCELSQASRSREIAKIVIGQNRDGNASGSFNQHT